MSTASLWSSSLNFSFASPASLGFILRPQNFWGINGDERGLGYASRLFVCFCFNFACALAVLAFIFCAACTFSSAFDLIRPPVFARSQAPEAMKIGSAGSSKRALSVPLFRGLGRWF
jgi:hypothetical protein